METNLEGIYAVGDVRDKYLRQIATAVGDGATAATAAERFIEEQKDFQENIMHSDKPVLLSFWTPDYDDSLEMVNAVDKAVAEAGGHYKTMEADYTRKKTLAAKFGIELNDNQHAAVVVIKEGKKVGELDLSADLAGQLK